MQNDQRMGLVSNGLRWHAARRWLALLILADVLAARPAAAVRFRFPVDNSHDDIFAPWVIHCDHDGDASGDRTACVDFAGHENFPYCYNDHMGTDFILEGGVSAMEADSAPVLAAADGTVEFVEDGNYDHCHGSMESMDVTCDGYPMHANLVIVRHADGYRSIYAHFRRDSIVVAVDQVVACGDVLGLIGSSGYSSMPHVHFEVETPDGQWIDPFAGIRSQPQSLWVEQDGPKGLPAERCEGDPLPVVAEAAEPQAVEPVAEPAADDARPDASTVFDDNATETMTADSGVRPADALGPQPDADDTAGSPPDAVDTTVAADLSDPWPADFPGPFGHGGCLAAGTTHGMADSGLWLVLAGMVGWAAVGRRRSAAADVPGKR